MAAITRLPLFLLLVAVSAVMTFAPASYALSQGDYHDARSFFYAGLLGLILTAFVALALANRGSDADPMRQLLSLLAAFVLLPVLMAVPFHEAVRNTAFLSAYFEMVSSFTTTGMTLFPPERLSGAEHLWRAQVGWLGGLVMWVAAAAILAPMTLGGFEVTETGEPGQARADGLSGRHMTGPQARLWRSIRVLTPLYAALTGLLATVLVVTGEAPLVAICHAMGVMATSGISPVAGPPEGSAGMPGEVLIALFLVFALSRLTFSNDTGAARGTDLRADPEFRLGMVLVVSVGLALFLRQWLAAAEIGDAGNLGAALRALWGALFTTLSFLATAGYVSADWAAAQDWSGLPTPGLVLLGLALVGGGVATTAGGVKLLRIYALGLNGGREIHRLVHPHSVGSQNALGRRIRRQGGFIAWVFFMLFGIILAALAVALGLAGQGFEAAMVLSVAALTNTGPLVTIAAAAPLEVQMLGAPAKLILSAGMVLGRLELLAIIVMLSPELWRD
jgi:trk system potassium uptake protein TrkH